MDFRRKKGHQKLTQLDRYLEQEAEHFRILPALKALIADTKEALAALPGWEKGFHIFWLLGPFVLLIERTPADIWLSLLVLVFVIRSIVKRDGTWLRPFWVRASFAFWFWCLIAGAISPDPSYAMGEAFIWFRFPLFAMATAFWLARDKRLLYAMLVSTALGLMTMCCILTAEILIVGQQSGRLSWPYGDLVPGNYVAKVGLPVVTMIFALAVSVKGRIAAFSGIAALFTMVVSAMTGERINFLISACGFAGRACLETEMGPVSGACGGDCAGGHRFVFSPAEVASRYTERFIRGVTDFETSVWWHTLNGGWQVAKDNLFVGIGTANYRNIAETALQGIPFTKPDPHPHNYYLQFLLETGVIGLVLGTVFLWSIIWTCFRASLSNRNHVFIATAWVIPFGLFWPIATSGDFFGQWNNIFMWSAVALAVAPDALFRKAR